MIIMMGFWLILPLLLIGDVAYALGLRPQIDHPNPAQSSHTPLDFLKERYARGEIGREDYEQIRQDLAS